jgi:hypothetical protein
MPLLDLNNITTVLSKTWAGYLRDWDRTLRSGPPGARRVQVCPHDQPLPACPRQAHRHRTAQAVAGRAGRPASAPNGIKIMATRLVLIHEEGRPGCCPGVLTDER